MAHTSSTAAKLKSVNYTLKYTHGHPSVVILLVGTVQMRLTSDHKGIKPARIYN